MKVTHLNLDVPALFPTEQVNAFFAAARSRIENGGDKGVELGAAVVSVAYRLRAALEDAEELVGACDRPDTSIEGNFRRDKLLFRFIMNGHAALESACYACWALAALLPKDPLSVDEREHTRPPLFLRKKLPANGLGGALKTLLEREFPSPDKATSKWTEWDSLRHTLAHRSYVGRNISVALGSSWREERLLTTGSSKMPLTFDQPSIESWAAWLADMVRQILVAGRPLAA
jgi:hypothetical protein